MTVMRTAAIVLAGCTIGSVPLAAENFTMPPEVTPALRSACESDVRRLCIDDSPTVEKVKACVQRRYSELSSRCKLAIAAAGLGRGQSASKEPAKRGVSAPSDRSSAAPANGSIPAGAVVGFDDR